MATDGDEVSLLISDNGKGFEPGKKSMGVGLHNITNRAKLFHGQVDIDSAPGAGCRLYVKLKSKSKVLQEYD